MKIGIIKISLIITVILLLLIPAVLINNYINDAKDFKSTLADSTSYSKENNPGTDSPDVIPDENKTAVTGSVACNTFNLLFLGTDRTDERDDWLKVYRTDNITLASINPDTKNIKILCIPRDTYVYIPVKSKMDKVNHAYVWGGMGEKGIQSTIATLEQFLKYVSIDYYFTIDMGPVPEIVDSLGGIELDVEIDMKTHGANLSKGLQLLDGQKASYYIQWRYSSGGDIDRIKRQQKFVKAMYEKLKESGQLINAMKLILNYNEYIKTNLSAKQLISLCTMAADINAGNTLYYIIPGIGKYIDGISYWVPDEDKTDALLKDFFK